MKRTERIEKEQARKKRIKEMAVRYCQGESLQSIASSYGISRQAVSQTLHNLLEKVDVELYKMFIHSRDNNAKIEMHINYFFVT